jgi:predicted GIY-YIG superfamily endonuclease
MAFWAYMLKCADGRYYTGHTDNLERRIGEYQSGACDYTSRRLPVELVWSEAFVSRVEALEAERIVGGWSRAKKEALIAGDWKRVGFFARPPKERFSTSLETNGESASITPSPFVSSEVEKPESEDQTCP